MYMLLPTPPKQTPNSTGSTPVHVARSAQADSTDTATSGQFYLKLQLLHKPATSAASLAVASPVPDDNAVVPGTGHTSRHTSAAPGNTLPVPGPSPDERVRSAPVGRSGAASPPSMSPLGPHVVLGVAHPRPLPHRSPLPTARTKGSPSSQMQRAPTAEQRGRTFPRLDGPPRPAALLRRVHAAPHAIPFPPRRFLRLEPVACGKC